MTRLGDRIRIGGTAELTGWRLKLSQDRRETLELSFNDMFGGADLSRARYWAGLRPCTPHGTPVIGPAGRHSHLWLNTGPRSPGSTSRRSTPPSPPPTAPPPRACPRGSRSCCPPAPPP